MRYLMAHSHLANRMACQSYSVELAPQEVRHFGNCSYQWAIPSTWQALAAQAAIGAFSKLTNSLAKPSAVHWACHQPL